MPFCQVDFNSEDLNTHIRKNHSLKEKYPCYVCGTLITGSGLQGHINQHLKPDHYSECPHCMKNVLKLEKHLNKCNQREVICVDCGKLVKKKELESHVAKHQNRFKYFCSICGYGATEKGIFRKHQRTHEDPTPCPECGERVKNMKHHTIAKHMPDEQKPFRCQDCGKGFFAQLQVRKHRMSVHLKTRPFICRYGCTFAYNDSSNRNAHEKKKHGRIFPKTDD